MIHQTTVTRTRFNLEFNMRRDKLIKQCRYYKGQTENPFTDGDIAWFWDMERVYVKNEGKPIGEHEVYRNIHGRKFKGIPYNLLIVMFTSWAKSAVAISANIDKFYDLMDLYLDFVSEN